MKSKHCLIPAALLCVAAAHAVQIVPNAKVTGTGNDDTKIVSDAFAIEPNTPYVFSCGMRHPSGDNHEGVAVMKPAGVSMYYTPKGGDWKAFTNAFFSLNGISKGKCELRQWHIKGDYEFRDVNLVKAVPRYRRVGDVEIGYGESIDGNTYRFNTQFSSMARSHSRPISRYRDVPVSATVNFWRRSEMCFTHELGGRTFLSGQVGYTLEEAGKGGAVSISLSRDDRSWVEVLAVSNVGVHHAEIPSSMLPAKKLFVRLSCASNTSSSVSMRQYMFDAKIDGAPAFGFGATEYLDAESGKVLLSVKPWDYLQDVTSGEAMECAPGGVACWTQSSGRKVFLSRPAPVAKGRSIRIAAARNEVEATQLVLRPDRPLKGVKLKATLPDGIEVDVRRVGYVLVDLPMDSMGARGMWPDPIFPQDAEGCDIRAGENQPFWITAKPRRGTAPGVYRGAVEVSAAEGMKPFSVPLEVRVFGFDFPNRMTCKTSFGLDFKTVFKYHHAVKEADRKAIADKYLKMFADHHIAPYMPYYGATTATWTEKWSRPPDKADAIPMFSWDSWDSALAKAIYGYGFNSFTIPVKGKGSGEPANRQAHRNLRRINGVAETNALYEVYMERYLKGIENHLLGKGWLDVGYIYAFDEPNKEDYDYMKEDLARFKKYAPGLRRMVTMSPCEELYGYVNLWCPITEGYDRKKAWARQAAGDEVWWYITFSSKPPKVNEHLEHAGVDMRVWLWQTWLEKVTGVLIWETACWTRNTIYTDPERPQNPYEDTIVWAKNRPWNTGEGRYVYPPLRCFATKEPVLEGPVDSVRFEMLREGVEDYEYFAILKRLDPSNALLAVPPEVTTSTDDYSTDPAAMESYRVRLADEIERLSKKETR